MFDVYIIGAGQIGSRHLQALKAVNSLLSIKVIDPNPISLKIAKERYESMPEGQFQHQIDYLTEIPKNKKMVDLAIIPTCSDIRAEVIKKLLALSKVKDLILEKILFNKISDYNSIGTILRRSKTKAWINFTARAMPFYNMLKQEFKTLPITYNVVAGDQGLVTNAIHYLDQIAYFTGSDKFTLDTSALIPRIFKSKRKGFFELCGTIRAHFSDGSIGNFTFYPESDHPPVISISNDRIHYIIRGAEKEAWRAKAPDWRWENIQAPILLQSQVTNNLVEELISTGTCQLTTYEKACSTHLQMLPPLLKFFNQHSRKKYITFPFT